MSPRGARTRSSEEADRIPVDGASPQSIGDELRGRPLDFVGSYEHSLDDKGRMVLPTAFRSHFSEGAYLAKWQDGCLALMTEQTFRRVAEEKMALARAGREIRNIARAFGAGTAVVTPSKQGRIVIPANLRSYAGLTRDIVIVGALSVVEIWDSQRWAEIDQAGDEGLAAGTDLDLSASLWPLGEAEQ